MATNTDWVYDSDEDRWYRKPDTSLSPNMLDDVNMPDPYSGQSTRLNLNELLDSSTPQGERKWKREQERYERQERERKEREREKHKVLVAARELKGQDVEVRKVENDNNGNLWAVCGVAAIGCFIYAWKNGMLTPFFSGGRGRKTTRKKRRVKRKKTRKFK
jgi:hypothetical protein